jgi:hypothetical protein
MKQPQKKNEDHFPDWSVTICFYAALHWVEGYAEKQGVNIEKEYDGRSPHERRQKYVDEIAKQLGNRLLRIAYNYLEAESKKARYLEGLNISAKEHYKKSPQKVREAFQRLQTVKQLLSS